MRVPGGPGAGGEVHRRGRERRGGLRCGDWVDVDVAGEPLGGPLLRCDVSCDLMTSLPLCYQGWLAGPTVNSPIVVSSGWSIAIATTLAIRSGGIWYVSYTLPICSAVSLSLIVPSSSVPIAAG